MPQKAIPRYQPAFRKDEIELILRFAARGESVGLVGIAGVGKSNIVNFLRDLPHNAPEVAQGAAQLYFPVVDATQWQGTADSLWKLMLEAFSKAIKDIPHQLVGNDKTIPFSADERIQSTLRRRLEWVCQESGRQVMFVLDDFDKVIEQGPLSMLEGLNVFRSEGNRELLSYLVFTKRLPHILGRRLDFENQSKFYDLFRSRIYALEPYNRTDALRMLQHLRDLARSTLTDHQLEQIYHLAGGHAGLLRLVFNNWDEKGVTGPRVAYFANIADIQQECRRILINLHKHEQMVALKIAKSSHVDKDRDVINHLANRGLLVRTEPPTWFSPLFEQILRTQEG